MGDRPVALLIEAAAERLGREAFAARCVALLRGEPREQHLDLLPALTGHDWSPGSPVRDPAVWQDHWLRTWGARGLLHAWHDLASDAVVVGLADAAWRPAEMCLRVVAAHDVAGAGDGAAGLAGHELARVRAVAARALAVVGDTEHVAALEQLLDDADPAVRRTAGRAVARLHARLGR